MRRPRLKGERDYAVRYCGERVAEVVQARSAMDAIQRVAWECGHDAVITVPGSDEAIGEVDGFEVEAVRL